MGTTQGPQHVEPAWQGYDKDDKDASVPVGEEVTVVIHLALDAEGHPFGTLRCGDGEPAGFAGWLDLMAEISAVLGSGGPSGAQQSVIFPDATGA